MQIQPHTETWIEHHMLITSENMLFASETAVLCNLCLHPSLPLGLLQLHKDLLYVKEKGLRERVGLHNDRQSSFSSLSHPFPVYCLSRVSLRHGPRLLFSPCMKRLHIYSIAFLCFCILQLHHLDCIFEVLYEGSGRVSLTISCCIRGGWCTEV